MGIIVGELSRALDLQTDGRFAEAAALCRRILAWQPAHAPALQLLGLAEYRMGNVAAGIDAILRARAAMPGLRGTQENLDNAIRVAFPKAVALHNAAKVDAAALYCAILRARPETWEARGNLAALMENATRVVSILHRDGQLADAGLAVRTILEACPAGVGEGERAAGLLDLARALALDLYRQGAPRPAADLCRAVLRNRPGDPDALHMQAIAERACGNGAAALALAAALRTLAPDHPGGSINLDNAIIAAFEEAVAHHTAGRLADAHDLYRDLLRVRPDVGEARNNLMLVMRQMSAEAVDLHRRGELLPAAALYRRLCRALPKSEDLRRNMAILDGQLVDRALVHHQAGRTGAATALYRYVLDGGRGEARIWRLLGLAAEQDGKLEDALDALSAAVILDPGLPGGRGDLAGAIGRSYAAGATWNAQGLRLEAAALHTAIVRACNALNREPDSTTVDRPFELFNIELTNRCPFKCVMCPRTNNMTRVQGLMDFALFKRIIDELVEANPLFLLEGEVWLHHFGESLVHPEVGAFASYAGGRGVRVALSLNPLMLTPDKAEALLEARPSRLYISLDGHDDASFERIRGVKDAYGRSVERLRGFLERKSRISPDTKVVLSMIDFGLNEESIALKSGEWRDVPGLDEVMAKPFVSWDGSAEDVNRLKGDRVVPQATRVMCRLPWERMTVTWDGDVVPCCYDYDKKYVLGNVRSQSLAEIWNGTPMRLLREEFMSNRVVNPLCRNCEHLRATDQPGLSS